MKRLNPKTGKPFKLGDVREDGYLFSEYQKRLRKDGTFYEIWLSEKVFNNQRISINSRRKALYEKDLLTKQGHIKHLLKNAKQRARKSGVFYNLTQSYAESIAVDICPVFGTKLLWAQFGNGADKNSPSLDKIIPEKGYVKGNVQWISLLANMMKRDATLKQLHQFADWVKLTSEEK